MPVGATRRSTSRLFLSTSFPLRSKATVTHRDLAITQKRELSGVTSTTHSTMQLTFPNAPSLLLNIVAFSTAVDNSPVTACVYRRGQPISKGNWLRPGKLADHAQSG